MASTTFTYRPLETSTTIRLIKINPELEDDVIFCTLAQFSINNSSAPDYIALSYCWGDTSIPPASRIRIRYMDDQTFHPKLIYENLWNLLNQLRSSEERTTLYYWMDALCLDQDSADEKAEQIPRMGTIYSEALRTISWLGRPDVSNTWISRAIDFLPGWVKDKRLAVEEILRSVPVEEFKLSVNGDHKLRAERETMRQLGTGTIEPYMRNVLSQPYWTRVWVIQEVALAKNVEIVFGTHHLEFDDFLIAYKAWVGSMLGSSIRPAAIQARMELSAGRVTFNELMQWGMACESSEPLDRVYGLLGLLKHSKEANGASFCSNSYSRSLVADYTKTGGQLFWELVFGFELHRNLIKRGSGQVHAFADSLKAGCILDVQGLLKIAHSSTTPAKHRLLAHVCVQAMSLFQTMFQLVGSAYFKYVFISGFDWTWLRSWISQVPAYKQAAEHKDLEEDEIDDAVRLWLDCYVAEPAGKQGLAFNKLSPGWHVSSNQKSSVSIIGCDSTLKPVELYSPEFWQDKWDGIRQSICGFYTSGSAGHLRFPHDSGFPSLGLDIQMFGWKLKFELSPEFQKYMAEGKFSGGNLIIGKLTLDFGS